MVKEKSGLVCMLLGIFFLNLPSSVYCDTEIPYDTLFNGKDLTGWSLKCPSNDFMKFVSIKDNAICIETNGGNGSLWVYSDQEYTDFILKLKFMAPSGDNGNSGVNFGSYFDPNDDGGYLHGPQVDIYSKDSWRTGLILDMTKGNERWLSPNLRDWNISKQSTPAGWQFYYEPKWNDLEIRVKDLKVTTIVNGITCVDNWDGEGVLNDQLHKSKNVGEKGHIALQAHSEEKVKIYFKDIIIQDLTRSESDPEQKSNVSFSKITLTSQYFTECNNFGDFNNDGKMDVCSGPSWYEGPDFKKSHPVYHGNATNIESWASNWHSYVTDINADGYDDILYITYVTQGNCTWYTNPKNGTSTWKTNQIFSGVDNEHAMVNDVDGDGKPEIVGCKGGYYGYASINWDNPTSQCKWHNISFRGKWYANTHGLGVGDVNGDGRNDILGKEGWFEQPESLTGDPEWKFHEFYFAPKQPASVTKDTIGPAELNVYDVNGDGRNDVVSAMDSHGWGLAWWENVEAENGGITFEKHVIMDDRSKIDIYGVCFSEPHSVILCDIDGDGLLDIVSGKRWWVHSTWGRDPEPRAAPVVYWFRLTRNDDGTVKYTPHLIDSASGIGTQIAFGDINGDTYPDIMTASKKGAFIFLQERSGTPVGKNIVHAVKKTQKIQISKNVRGSVDVCFNLEQSSNVSIDVFTVNGQKIKSIVKKRYNEGTQNVTWNGTNDLGKHVSRGLYVIHMQAGNVVINKNMAIVW